MSTSRYTKSDVANILANVNDAGKRLHMRGAGSWAVETMGGTYLYLTDRSQAEAPPRHTIPGTRIIDLGASWHKAGEALITFLQHLHTVEIMQER